MDDRALLHPPSWPLLLALAGLTLAVHLVSTILFGYGYSADELYFLDCTDHLAWGYVDHPPLSIVLLSQVRAIAGDSLLVLRLAAAAFGAVAVVFAGLIAQQLGGGRAAQGLAAVAMLAAPVLHFVSGYYSLNVIEVSLWGYGAYVVLRLLNGGTPGLWLVLGVVIGLGLLNKHSMLWFAVGLFVGIILTPQRRWLRTAGPWVAAAIAAMLFAPHVVWQVQHDWPTLEFMRNGMRDVMVGKPPLTFVREQIRAMHPLGALLCVAGLAFYFGTPHGRRYCLLAWLWVTTFVILLASGGARPYYLAPAYAITFAGGARVIEQWAERRRLRWLPAMAALLLVVGGVFSAPLALPLLSPERYIAFERALGISRVQLEFEEGALPAHFALQFGWEELAQAVAHAYAQLPGDEQRHAGVLAFTFGEVAALNLYGPAYGLPHAVGTHNNYWLWGPSPHRGEVMVVVAASDEALRQLFDQVDRAGGISCQYCLPELRAKSVFICRQPRRPLVDAWPALKNFS